MVRGRIIAAIAGHRICPQLHSQRGLIIARSLTKKHIERITHPAYDFNNVWGHGQSALRKRDCRTVECWWNQRTSGGDMRIFQKQDTTQKTISNLSACHVFAWHKCSRWVDLFHNKQYYTVYTHTVATRSLIEPGSRYKSRLAVWVKPLKAFIADNLNQTK